MPPLPCCLMEKCSWRAEVTETTSSAVLSSTIRRPGPGRPPAAWLRPGLYTPPHCWRMARLSLSAVLELKEYRWRALNFINLSSGPRLHRLRSCGTLATDIRPCSCSMAGCSSPRDLRLLVTRAHIPRARKISSPDAFGNPGYLAPLE